MAPATARRLAAGAAIAAGSVERQSEGGTTSNLVLVIRGSVSRRVQSAPTCRSRQGRPSASAARRRPVTSLGDRLVARLVEADLHAAAGGQAAQHGGRPQPAGAAVDEHVRARAARCVSPASPSRARPRAAGASRERPSRPATRPPRRRTMPPRRPGPHAERRSAGPPTSGRGRPAARRRHRRRRAPLDDAAGAG